VRLFLGNLQKQNLLQSATDELAQMELEIHNVIKTTLAACLHDVEAFFAALSS